MTASVLTESAAVASMSRHWPMLRALLGGTASMRDAGKAFLPQWPNEDDDSYKARLAVATLYPAYGRTVEVLAGKPFSKPLTLGENVPARIAAWMTDADMLGRNLHTFAADVMTDCIGYGPSGVLVDFPRADGVRTVADERAAGARPYLVRYSPGTVLGWRTVREGGATKLTQLRLLEIVHEDDGDFGEKEIEQVRVLTPGAWEVWRKSESGDSSGSWVKVDEGTTTLSAIPFVFFYGKQSGFGVSDAPILDLAFQNVEHWQSNSDQQTILHVARVPILAVIGAEGETSITVGAKSAVKLPSGADMRFVEHSGAAIEAGRQSLKDLEDRMRQAGAEMLVMKSGSMTATQNQNEAEANRSALQRIVESVEDGLDQCLQFAADWVGEANGGNVSLFKDFGALSLAEAMQDLMTMKLSDETRFEEAQRRGLIAPDRKWEDERDRLNEQGPALGSIGASGGEDDGNGQ